MHGQSWMCYLSLLCTVICRRGVPLLLAALPILGRAWAGYLKHLGFKEHWDEHWNEGLDIVVTLFM
jgi:hypothetical protein